MIEKEIEISPIGFFSILGEFWGDIWWDLFLMEVRW